MQDLSNPKYGQHREPNEHNRPERPAHDPGAETLEHEQKKNNDQYDLDHKIISRDNDRLKPFYQPKTFNRRGHGDRRGYDSIGQQSTRPNDRRVHEFLPVSPD